MAMNPNFGLPVHAGPNNSFLPPNNNYNPNSYPSFPMYQQNAAPQFPPHQNLQHSFQSNSHYPAPMSSPFLPDLHIIKSVPPPPLMSSAPPALSSNRIPETPTPAWNSAPTIDNRHFLNQSSQFQRPPSASNFVPSMFPSTNYNNINQTYSGSSGSSNGFSNQQNSLKDASGLQTSNVFQRNYVAAFTNISSDSSAQPRPNCFDYEPNGIRYEQNNGKAAFSNASNSTNCNVDKRSPLRFNESGPMQSNSNQGFWPPGFGGFSNSAQNANDQVRQKSPYMMESNCRIPHNASLNNYHNNGNSAQNANDRVRQKAPYMMESNFKIPHASTNNYHNNGNRRHNPFVSKFSSHKNRKYNRNESASHLINLPHGDQDIEINSGQGKKNMKTERNSEVSKPYSCDTCDRAFASEVEIRQHLSEHIKCNSGNCQFEAHPKIVALHKKMQHDTGYADAISKLKSADDIEKWRAERRRRFPTVENIQKRKAEEAEKEARGEVIENKDFGKFKGQNKQQNGCRNNNQGNAKKRRRYASRTKNAARSIEYPHSVSKVTINVSGSESDSDDDSHIKLPKFLGMTAVHTPEEGNLEFLSHELSTNCKEVKNDGPQNIISNSVIDVNSDGESPIELHESKDTSSTKQSIERDDVTQNKISKSTIDVDSDDESPIEIPVKKSTPSILQSIEIVELPQNAIFNSVVDGNSDDDSPIYLPIRKSTLSTNQCIERDHIPPKTTSNSTIDVSSNDESPIELPIRKDTPFTNQNNERDHMTPKTTSNSTIDVSSNDESLIELPVRKDTPFTNQNNERDHIPSKTTSNSTIDVSSNDESPIELPVRKDAPFTNQNNKREVNTGYKNSNAKVCREWTGNKEYTLPPRKSSLLEKLLADDIRHERNAIMQCIRHVVKKNFFGIV